MPDLPLISVVVCTYNGERFLRQQLDSILSQTYQNFEVVISDDASTDSTREILEEYQGDQKIKLYFEPVNKGYVANFEGAIKKTNGSFIACSDQDDIWLPEKLETLYRSFRKELLVYSDSMLIDEEGAPLGRKLSELRNMYTGEETKGFFLSNVVWGHALMVRRELLSFAMPVPDGTPHDIWLAVKAASNGGIRYCDKVLTRYRQHEKTYTKTLKPEKIRQRSKSARYDEYNRQTAWLEILQDNAAEGEKAFFEKLSWLFRKKDDRKFSYSLFWFLLKHQHGLYQFSKKNLLSRLIDIRKLSRGERY